MTGPMTETAKLEALKPCPFCGCNLERNDFQSSRSVERRTHRAESECILATIVICMDDREDDAERRAAWNTRALSRPAVKGLAEEVERLRPHYQSNSMLDVGRRQLLDHFAELALSSLSPPTGGWQPIATADKSIAVDMQFPGAPRMLHSYPIWVRADGGKPFEASWVQRHADRPEGYWWGWDAEDVVDPDEWMPHPLQPLPSPPEAE